jgi:hypothetical protein
MIFYERAVIKRNRRRVAEHIELTKNPLAIRQVLEMIERGDRYRRVQGARLSPMARAIKEYHHANHFPIAEIRQCRAGRPRKDQDREAEIGAFKDRLRLATKGDEAATALLIEMLRAGTKEGFYIELSRLTPIDRPQESHRNSPIRQALNAVVSKVMLRQPGSTQDKVAEKRKEAGSAVTSDRTVRRHHRKIRGVKRRKTRSLRANKNS